jgi:hypothetical protein
MTRTHRILIAIFAGVILLVSGAAYATWRAFTSHGLITVDVAEKSMAGNRVRIVLPGVLLRAGTCALSLAPEHELARIRRDLDDVMPMMQAVVEELEAMPDMTIVRVESERESVRIGKKDGHLVIDVETDDEDVHVAVPIGAVGEVLRALGDA